LFVVAALMVGNEAFRHLY